MNEPVTGMDEEGLEALCAGWPGVTRSLKWEVDLVYSVANKMFAVMCAIGPDRGRLSFKVDPERFLELSDQPGMAPAHYMARAFWISLGSCSVNCRHCSLSAGQTRRPSSVRSAMTPT